MNLKISDIANYLSYTFSGFDLPINKVSIDSREVTEGDLFIAIPGHKHDGHRFISDAIDNGAKSVIYNKSHIINDNRVPTISVDNTIIALGIIARNYKNKIGSPNCCNFIFIDNMRFIINYTFCAVIYCI